MLGAATVLFGTLACSPAGRHANPDTLPYPVRMPFQLTTPCNVLNNLGDAGWPRVVMPIRAYVGVSGPLQPLREDSVIVTRPRPRDSRMYGFTLPCHRATDHAPSATISFWIRAVEGTVPVNLVGETSGGVSIQANFAARSLTLDSHWRRIRLSGAVAPNRDSVALLVEANQTVSTAGFLVRDIRIAA